jgi:hypothetical protein
MTHYQDDKYENFFRFLKVGRTAFAKFGDFTATALGATGVDKLISGQLTLLTPALAAFRLNLVNRTATGGKSQAGTATEQTAFIAFKKFIQSTDVKLVQPYLFDNPDKADTYYPSKLSGLTQAPKPKRLERLTAYTLALEASPTDPLKAAGVEARKLLTAYTTALDTKTKGRTGLKDTISDLGPDAVALADALWQVHCAALYVHRATPELARAYFDYAGLPSRLGGRRRAVVAKATM